MMLGFNRNNAYMRFGPNTGSSIVANWLPGEDALELIVKDGLYGQIKVKRVWRTSPWWQDVTELLNITDRP